MRTLWLAAVQAAWLVGCGGDDGPADASNVPPMITISGDATARSLNPTALANVMVGAYRGSNETTAVATATTAANGNYSMVIQTNGQALDGFLKATLSGYIDTYLYPPAPVVADFAGASINMITADTLTLLANTLCGANQLDTNGVVALLVVDAADMPLAGVTVASSPASNKVCYNANGIPSRNAIATDTDGVAYIFNVTGQVTVSAAMAGTEFPSHPVNARSGAFTTTVIQP